MHSAGLEHTKLTYTRVEDNLIRHRGDRSDVHVTGKDEFQLFNRSYSQLTFFDFYKTDRPKAREREFAKFDAIRQA